MIQKYPKQLYPELPSFRGFFQGKWEDKKNPKLYLSQYHSMRRRESESMQEFSHIFMKTYNSILSQLKPTPGSSHSNMLKPLIVSSLW